MRDLAYLPPFYSAYSSRTMPCPPFVASLPSSCRSLPLRSPPRKLLVHGESGVYPSPIVGRGWVRAAVCVQRALAHESRETRASVWASCPRAGPQRRLRRPEPPLADPFRSARPPQDAIYAFCSNILSEFKIMIVPRPRAVRAAASVKLKSVEARSREKEQPGYGGGRG